MKTFLKHLLGLALMVLVFSGCQNPSGPETPDVNEPPVVEVPEDNTRWVEVEFKWSENPEIGNARGKEAFKIYSVVYLLGLQKSSEYDGYDYVYDLPKEYEELFLDLVKKGNEENFEKFSDEVFKSVFGTKVCKEGDIIDLTQYTSRAIRIVSGKFADCLRFSLEDTGETENLDFKNTIEVGDKDIVVYVFWDSEYIDFEN